MSLTSSSTDAEVSAAYLTNLDYDIDGSVSKAREFMRACRFLIHKMAQEIEHGGKRVQDTYLKYQSELAKAEGWLRLNDTAYSSPAAGRVVLHRSLEEFRT
jgi:hypothetical protein